MGALTTAPLSAQDVVETIKAYSHIHGCADCGRPTAILKGSIKCAHCEPPESPSERYRSAVDGVFRVRDLNAVRLQESLAQVSRAALEMAAIVNQITSGENPLWPAVPDYLPQNTEYPDLWEVLSAMRAEIKAESATMWDRWTEWSELEFLTRHMIASDRVDVPAHSVAYPPRMKGTPEAMAARVGKAQAETAAAFEAGPLPAGHPDHTPLTPDQVTATERLQPAQETATGAPLA